MSFAQRFLNEFLQAEIYHSLGSYGYTAKYLEYIFDKLAKQPASDRNRKGYHA